MSGVELARKHLSDLGVGAAKCGRQNMSLILEEELHSHSCGAPSSNRLQSLLPATILLGFHFMIVWPCFPIEWSNPTGSPKCKLFFFFEGLYLQENFIWKTSILEQTWIPKRQFCLFCMSGSYESSPYAPILVCNGRAVHLNLKLLGKHGYETYKSVST